MGDETDDRRAAGGAGAGRGAGVRPAPGGASEAGA